jgi:hypothetical protein
MIYARKIKRTGPTERIARIQQSRLLGEQAVGTEAGRELQALLGVEFTHLERWRSGEQHHEEVTWYIGIPGSGHLHGYRPRELRNTSTLSRLTSHWRRVQNVPYPNITLTTEEARRAMRLFHRAFETAEEQSS